MAQLPTPVYNIEHILNSNVYEPSEDTFLLLDALESDLPSLECLNPALVVEIGPGSGLIITALAKLLQGKAQCLAVDINPNACVVTQNTSESNGVKVEVIQSDLLSGLRREQKIDVLVFNPPYVVTPSEEVTEGEVIVRAYAGGHKGREVMDRLFPLLSSSLSDKGILYLLVIKENDPEDIIHRLSQYGFMGKTLLTRQVPGEKLSVLKFTRSCDEKQL
ncbi:hypothetical protein M8J76_009333 [Diaphorina citri]|nr:hypothetical protein M8J75_006011 [Diaphorina citri]KAI5737012.1 hypothetical protein M8J76_009333 [Diaphorina citri]KAI5742575.1 hypothetical protein M8J77_008772 [Diaphorina citri]